MIDLITMITLIVFIVSILVLISLLTSYLYHHYRYQYPIKYRIATHEAGHTIAAWACTLVDEITSVNTLQTKNGDRGGLTSFTIYGKTIGGMWCDLVITLAGIAAEVDIYGRFRSMEAEEDLRLVWKLSQQLANEKHLLAPWQLPQAPNLPFDQIYRRLSSDQTTILEQAYLMARHLLLQHHHQYKRLMSALIDKPILLSEQIKEVLGTRLSGSEFSSQSLFVLRQ